ncbi:hypothetical protein A2V49_03675 [candidate division WWE3 bacterium RBG_19FT_COMBO_34_6]|uniref:DUF4145 domain-containing protein n=1 Tax=candidate division WWE3 bacterium RBG_19FT_COMBO_34_6 TaxID=1802612 RepID=A0A1F4UKT9_UNCKA|nr:MAG: hypothetical protein A2V49_03675 [candidate division WWE3 bacterium RBG_19FT_COMBO_34_6]
MVFNLFKFFSFPNNSIQKFSRVSNQTLSLITNDWTNIDLLKKQGSPSQLRQALIAADKSLDNALKDMVSGENMGERLKNAGNMYERDIYNKIWNAHKIRNSLVHESGYEPPHFMLEKAIEDLRKALNLIGVRV